MISQPFTRFAQSLLSLGAAATTTTTATPSIKNDNTKVNLTCCAINIVLINDLNALDQALFKVHTDFLSLKTHSYDGNRFYELQGNLQLTADYFDLNVNRWEPLLTNPFECTLQMNR